MPMPTDYETLVWFEREWNSHRPTAEIAEAMGVSTAYPRTLAKRMRARGWEMRDRTDDKRLPAPRKPTPARAPRRKEG